MKVEAHPQTFSVWDLCVHDTPAVPHLYDGGVLEEAVQTALSDLDGGRSVWALLDSPHSTGRRAWTYRYQPWGKPEQRPEKRFYTPAEARAGTPAPLATLLDRLDGQTLTLGPPPPAGTVTVRRKSPAAVAQAVGELALTLVAVAQALGVPYRGPADAAALIAAAERAAR